MEALPIHSDSDCPGPEAVQAEVRELTTLEQRRAVPEDAQVMVSDRGDSIAIAITLAVDLIIALWAPADLIIEDPTGYALLDLAERTGADFPAPTTPPCSTEGGIDVKVAPVEKIPLQYRERREYASSDEDSRYAIVYRFNRTA